MKTKQGKPMKAKEAKTQMLSEQKSAGMPLRIAMASGKMPAIGTNNGKVSKGLK